MPCFESSLFRKALYSSAVVDGLLSAKEQQTKVWDFPGKEKYFPTCNAPKKETHLMHLSRKQKLRPKPSWILKIRNRPIVFKWICEASSGKFFFLILWRQSGLLSASLSKFSRLNLSEMWWHIYTIWVWPSFTNMAMQSWEE